MITPRLECILKSIQADCIADVGTDHAYIPIRAVSEGICRRAIACDIRKGPCDTARRHIRRYGLEDRIQVRLGRGLCPVSAKEADQFIIAGMGGELIRAILEESVEKAKMRPLILQPMNCQQELRHYLIENGFVIEREDLAAEGFKVYNLMLVRAGKMKPFEKEIDYHIPPYLEGHPHFSMLYQKKKREFTRIYEGMQRSASPDPAVLEKYGKLLNQLKERYKERE